MTSPFPRPDQRLLIVVDAADPFERGADRGRQQGGARVPGPRSRRSPPWAGHPVG